MQRPIELVIRSGQAETIKALREYAVRRLSFALRRFEGRIRRVTLRLIDVNGPRKGIDSRCSITLDLVEGRRIFLSATTDSPFASVTFAVARLSHAISREVRRSQAHLSRVNRWDSIRKVRTVHPRSPMRVPADDADGRDDKARR